MSSEVYKTATARAANTVRRELGSEHTATFLQFAFTCMANAVKAVEELPADGRSEKAKHRVRAAMTAVQEASKAVADVAQAEALKEDE